MHFNPKTENIIIYFYNAKKIKQFRTGRTMEITKINLDILKENPKNVGGHKR